MQLQRATEDLGAVVVLVLNHQLQQVQVAVVQLILGQMDYLAQELLQQPEVQAALIPGVAVEVADTIMDMAVSAVRV